MPRLSDMVRQGSDQDKKHSETEKVDNHTKETMSLRNIPELKIQKKNYRSS